MARFPRIVTLLFLVLALASYASSTAVAFAQAAATPIPCVSPPSGVVIQVENPSPGDTLMTGTQVIINGIAYDTGATSGAGISSVTAYLGSRDTGGTSLGIATLGLPNPNVPTNSQYANAGWSVRTPVLPAGNGGRSIFVYAKSLVGNAEGVVEVPIYLNAAPTPVKGQVPTPVLPTPPACTPTPAPSPTATATAPVAAVPTAAPPAAGTPTPPGGTPARAATTPTTLPTLAPPVPAAPAAPAAAPPAAAATTGPVAVSPATAQTTAPRGGGVPAELGLIVLAAGAAVVGGGLALRRRERRH
jgi:hypothetical protein